MNTGIDRTRGAIGPTILMITFINDLSEGLTIVALGAAQVERRASRTRALKVPVLCHAALLRGLAARIGNGVATGALRPALVIAAFLFWQTALSVAAFLIELAAVGGAAAERLFRG
jgi:hypothetical protein